MGQKTNPNIFKLEKTNNWQSKYFEKKLCENSIYSKKDLELKTFINQFFNNHNLKVKNCKLNYSNKSLNIFISYYSSLDISPFPPSMNKFYKSVSSKIFKDSVQNDEKHGIEFSTATFLKNITFITLNKFKIFLVLENLNYKKKHINNLLLLYFLIIIKKNTESKKTNIKFKKFKENFFNKNLKHFKFLLKNNKKTYPFEKKINTILYKHLIKIINSNVKNLKNYNFFLKNNLIKLKKYEHNDFFNEGINLLFNSTLIRKQMSTIISEFLVKQLEKLKRHNFFLKFIATILTIYTNNIICNITGIKIKIKGRINGRPRARSKKIKIKNGVSTITINSNIDYSEKTAFTSNGTMSVKVWVQSM